jgi:hypothetical protein
VVADDFDQDNKLDLAYGDRLATGVSLLYGKGDGTFAPGGNFVSGLDPRLAAADVDGDGRLDLLVFEYRSALQVLRNAGGGSFTPLCCWAIGRREGEGYVATDVNADGLPDVAVSTGGGVGVLLNTSK